MRLLHNKDFLAGLIFLAFGFAAIHVADRDYPMGSLMRMGPGNFPVMLGALLAFFGLFIAARGLWHAPPGTAVERLRWDWRPAGCIVGSMLAFGFLAPRAGLVPALAAMFFLAALGGREFRWREVAALTVVMTALAVVVFVYLLKLPFQLVRGVYWA